MIRNGLRRCWPVLVLLGLLAMVDSNIRSAPGEVQASDEAAVETSPPEHALEIPVEVVGDLMRLRQSPGLGLFSKENVFEPLSTEVTRLPFSADEAIAGDQELFAAELERLSRTSHCEFDSPCDVRAPRTASGAEAKRQPPTLPSGAKEALRAAAFELDKAAHLLECHEMYERGDQLRELAQQMRRDAREQSDFAAVQNQP